MKNKRPRRTQVVRQLVSEEEQKQEAIKGYKKTRQGRIDTIIKEHNLSGPGTYKKAKMILKEYEKSGRWDSIVRATKEISFIKIDDNENN